MHANHQLHGKKKRSIMQSSKLLIIQLCVWGGLFATETFAADGFTVSSYNVWHSGVSATQISDKFKVGAQSSCNFLGELLKSEGILDGSSFIGLQEVDVGTKRTAQIDFPKCIAQHLGVNWASKFAPTISLQGGEYGIANLYNREYTQSFVHKYTWSRDNPSYYGKEPRIAVGTKHEIADGKSIWIVNTHFGHEEEGRVASRQLFQLVGKLKSLDSKTPIILLGDLNISNKSKNAIKILEAILIDENNPTGFTQVSECADEICADRIFFV